MRDLEIRGAGNILGTRQHGFIAAVGFELYCRLLQEAVDELTGTPEDNSTPKLPETRLDIPLQAYIPTEYISDGSTRISIYQEMSSLKTTEELAETERGLTDRFGPMPESVKALIILMRLKILGRLTGCSRIVINKDGTLDILIDNGGNGNDDAAKNRIKKFFESSQDYEFEVFYDAQIQLRTELTSETVVMMAVEAAGILERAVF
jgi:transcription-repair coupling factor (superfamily II helicase)